MDGGLLYQRTVCGAGVVELPTWSIVRVLGADRATLLHNMCTNDVCSRQAGSGCEAFFTDVKGKIVAHAFVIVGEEAIELLLPGQDAGKLIAHLDRYIIREDVQLVDESPARGVQLALGPRAGELLQVVAEAPLPVLGDAWSHVEVETGGGPARAIRCDLAWCGGFLIVADADVRQRVLQGMTSAGAVAADEAVWHVIRVESACPLYGIDFDGGSLPQEVGRDDVAIHFRKGCYLGQETVARIDALGHVNKRVAMVRISGQSAPDSGSEIRRGDLPVGHVTSTTWSPRRQAVVALATLRRGANEVGVHLQCGAAAAEVIPTN